MNIYTSYFANVKGFSDNVALIPIVAIVPSWFKSEVAYSKLAPTKRILYEYKYYSCENKKLAEEIFVKRYKEEVLAYLASGVVFEELKLLSGGKDVVLLCYEKSNDFCHRHIVAQWFKETLGIEVRELKKGEKL